MKADEMFNELGYKKKLTKTEKQCNKERGFEWAITYKHKSGTIISFDMLDLEVWKYHNKLPFNCLFTHNEIKAINKKFEEYLEEE